MTTFVIYDVEENIPLGLGLPLELYLSFHETVIYRKYEEDIYLYKKITSGKLCGVKTL
jgi:hypothetical protein